MRPTDSIVIHSHLDADGLLIARGTSTPFVATLHGRLDASGVSELIKAMPDVPLISISDSQRRWNEDANWVATIHHGLDFSAAPVSDAPGDYLLLVGRVMPEKGIAEAIEVARQTGIRLVMAAKVKHPDERALFEAVVQPAIDDGVVDWRGEIGAEERDSLMAGALATLMLGAWPEPFGLVAIESMATGTPVIGRRAGALVETVRHGTTGYLVDDVSEAVLAVSRVGGAGPAADRRLRAVALLGGAHGGRARAGVCRAGGRPCQCAPAAYCASVRRSTPVTSTVRSRRARPFPQPLPGRDGRVAGPAQADGAAARSQTARP